MGDTLPTVDAFIIPRSFELLDAPTDNPVAKRVRARNNEPTAAKFEYK